MRTSKYDIVLLKNFINENFSNFEKQTFLVDIDNMLILLYRNELYENIDGYKYAMYTLIDSIFQFISNIREVFGDSLIIFVSSYNEDYQVLSENYKKKKYRKKYTKVDKKIIEFLSNYTKEEITDETVIKYTRRFLYSQLSKIINVCLYNTLWIDIEKIETDYVINYLYKNYSSDNTFYIILSNDKDYIQLLINENILLFRKTYTFKKNIFTNQKDLSSHKNILHRKTIQNLKNDIIKDFTIEHPFDLLFYLIVFGDTSDNIKSIAKQMYKDILNNKIRLKSMKDFCNNYILANKDRLKCKTFDEYLDTVYSVFDNELKDRLLNYKPFIDNRKLIDFDYATSTLFTNTKKQEIINFLKLKQSYKPITQLQSYLYTIFGYTSVLPVNINP
ncbi:MAG: hypothetical protein QXW35_04215 [Candidatus Aenigmatarchaeota archaeon]